MVDRRRLEEKNLITQLEQIYIRCNIYYRFALKPSFEERLHKAEGDRLVRLRKESVDDVNVAVFVEKSREQYQFDVVSLDVAAIFAHLVHFLADVVAEVDFQELQQVLEAVFLELFAEYDRLQAERDALKRDLDASLDEVRRLRFAIQQSRIPAEAPAAPPSAARRPA